MASTGESQRSLVMSLVFGCRWTFCVPAGIVSHDMFEYNQWWVTNINIDSSGGHSAGFDHECLRMEERGEQTPGGRRRKGRHD